MQPTCLTGSIFKYSTGERAPPSLDPLRVLPRFLLYNMYVLLLFRIFRSTWVPEKLHNCIGAVKLWNSAVQHDFLSFFIVMRTSWLVSGFPRADRMNNISLLRVAERGTWRKERERNREWAQSGPKLRFLDYASIHTVDNSSFAYFICHLSGIVGEGPGNSGFVNTVHPSCTSAPPPLQFPFH